MLVTIIILLILVVVLGYTTWNTLRKVEKYEDIIKDQQSYVENISSIIEDSNKRLQEIDEKGVFRSDDEVGFFFENLKTIQDVLDAYKLR